MHWKTTFAGVALIVAAVASAAAAWGQGQQVDATMLVTGFVAGLGLICAADKPRREGE